MNSANPEHDKNVGELTILAHFCPNGTKTSARIGLYMPKCGRHTDCGSGWRIGSVGIVSLYFSGARALRQGAVA